MLMLLAGPPPYCAAVLLHFTGFNPSLICHSAKQWSCITEILYGNYYPVTSHNSHTSFFLHSVCVKPCRPFAQQVVQKCIDRLLRSRKIAFSVIFIYSLGW